VKDWSAERVAEAAGAELVSPGPAGDGPGPAAVSIDSREAAPGVLFVGLPGTRVDGGEFAAQVLAGGAWGVLVSPEHAQGLPAAPGAVLAAEHPTAALGRLARAWRRELGAQVIAVTGSTGKTSTKDILAALLAPARRTVASRANLNTEIGLPLQVLGAPVGTEILVLELAMRGAGQIAELAEIAEPDVGVIVNVGPVHLELLGSIEAIAAAKAELMAGLAPGAVAIIPAGEPLLDPHRRDDLETLTFGPGGDAEVLSAEGSAVRIALRGREHEIDVSFTQPHQRTNLLAALLAAGAVGVEPPARLDVPFSAGRGARVPGRGGVTVVDDCYNANPMSMRAALDDLAGHDGRRVAVLGDMLELGPGERRFHEEIGAYARRSGVDVLVTVGPLAAPMAGAFGGVTHAAGTASEAASIVAEVVRPGDAVLVKGSRGVGLEAVVEALV
jgi:UDP-N-acetylmuramoyl-tripeptide--D-alanyl-D-alanine ligase